MSAYIRSKVSNNSVTDVSIEAKTSTAKLRQDGSFKLPYSSETSENSPLGSLRYNDITNFIEFKNPTGWKRVDQFGDADVVSESELTEAISSFAGSLATVATTGSYTDLINVPTNIATEEYVTKVISDLIGSAPEHLNTLNELAAALQDNVTFGQTIFAMLDNKLNLSGGNMTGPLYLNSDPLLPNEAATKSYVDSLASGIEVLNTDDIPEGSNNLYYKTTRVLTDAKNAVSAGTGVYYNPGTGLISIGQSVDPTSSVTFNTVTANQFISTNTGIPTITSATSIVLDAASEVLINSPITLRSYTSQAISDIIPDQGTIAYDSTTKTIKLHTGTVWVELASKTYVNNAINSIDIPTDISQLSDSYGLLASGGGTGTGSNEPGVDLDGGTFEGMPEFSNSEVIIAGDELDLAAKLPVFENISIRNAAIPNPEPGTMILCGPKDTNGNYTAQVFLGASWANITLN